MGLFCQRDRYVGRRLAVAGVILASLAVSGIAGCANPGPPHAPSLNLPRPVKDLAVSRSGDTVELRFTSPTRTTDDLPLRGQSITGILCRETTPKTCTVPPGMSPRSVAIAGPDNAQTWDDSLPADLTAGKARLLGYRVEFFNAKGKSAGRSEAAYTIAGEAPAAVAGLHVEGSRLGVLVSWNATQEPGEVLLEREDLAPGKHAARRQNISSNGKPNKSNAAAKIVWLDTHARAGDTQHPAQTLDTTAEPDMPYRYTAMRRATFKFGDRTLELRSAKSAAIEFTLHATYPPLAPTALTAVGFVVTAADGAASPFAVDLIWQPVSEPGLIAELAGYNVYRESAGARTKLNTAVVVSPAFHDATALASARYRYSVTAVDVKGNESPAATAVLEPSAQ